MTPYWFEKPLPASRHTIENTVRLSFWSAGLGGLFVTCLQEHAPYNCSGVWHDATFTMEWMPNSYLTLTMKEPNKELLESFEKVLGHKALAAYRDANNMVVVEWRTSGLRARYGELQTSGVKELEKLS